MKKIVFPLFLSLVVPLLFSGCSPKDADGGKLSVVCGLPPVAGIAAAVGGDFVKVTSLLPEGRSPHDYAPRPADIRTVSRAKIFFTTGMAFEERAAASLRNVRISDVSRSLARREFDGRVAHHGGGHSHHHHHSAMDPHIWLSPANASVIAGVIADEFCRLDPAHAEEFRKNCAALQARLAETERRMKTELAPYAGRSFFVYHPSFGYFADAAGLRQCAIEIDGREPKPGQLAALIREAKEHQVRVIFVQPQFNPAAAKTLAAQIGCEIVPMDPLAQDLPGNLQKITDTLIRGFSGGRNER